MSKFEQGFGGPMTNVDQIHDNPCIQQENDIEEPRLRTNAGQLADDINAGEKLKDVRSDTRSAKLPQSLPRSKSVEPGDGEALESDRARIERLGRERPPQFNSLGAELAFCYSVIASQFMSVRSVATTIM